VRYEGLYSKFTILVRYEGLYSKSTILVRYEGNILMNLMDGEGVFSWPNGDKYSGVYINGR